MPDLVALSMWRCWVGRDRYKMLNSLLALKRKARTRSGEGKGVSAVLSPDLSNDREGAGDETVRIDEPDSRKDGQRGLACSARFDDAYRLR